MMFVVTDFSDHRVYLLHSGLPAVKLRFRSSGTDFENIYPELKQSYVANLTASERPGRPQSLSVAQDPTDFDVIAYSGRAHLCRLDFAVGR